MDQSRWHEVTQIFSAALEITDSESRARLVEERTADKDVQAEVLALLANWEEGGEQEPSAFSERQSFLGTGDRIGPYRILREVGRGGMGVVFEAERADGQFERRVALK